MADVLVIALGSTVMTDDAIGHHILSELQNQNLDADFAYLGTDIFRLRLYYKNHKEIIIIDALTGDYPPGTVLNFHLDDINQKLEASIRNAHRIGAIEALKIMQNDDVNIANAKIFFVGIIAESLDKGLELSSSTKQAIPKAVNIVKQYLTNR
ncbi:MAG: hydrogenase maturation protease [Asgard group archaeon]|nr:hydrogenase maturation protease [Asgard group archaeon]